MPNKSKTAKGGKKIVKAWAIFDDSVYPWIFHSTWRTRQKAMLEAETYGYTPKIVRCEISYSLKAKKK